MTDDPTETDAPSFDSIPENGIAYELSVDQTYYIVKGIGTCTDTEIVIPATYQTLPVKEIAADAFIWSGIARLQTS